MSCTELILSKVVQEELSDGTYFTFSFMSMPSQPQEETTDLSDGF